MNPTACTLADIGKLAGSDIPAGIVEAIDKYLGNFAKPIKYDFVLGEDACLKCGKPLSGRFGSFRWGIATGEGNCRVCGWPCRALHWPTKDGIAIFERPFQIILQYMPPPAMRETVLITPAQEEKEEQCPF